MQVNTNNKMKQYFYRFQNTMNIEKESYYIDIRMAYEDLEGYISCENIEAEILNKIENKYRKTFALRDNISPSELIYLISKSDVSNIENLMYNYKLPYIFGYRKPDIDKEFNLQQILNEDERPDFWNCEYDNYLVVYGGEEILDECDSGIIFKPNKIIKIYKNY